MKTRLAFIFVLVLLASLVGWQGSRAQPSGEFFPETGHWVTGEFLTGYHSTPEPLRIYGYPITDAFRDATTGRMVQYFQKARFELHPEAPVGQRIQITPLGKYLYTPGQVADLPDNSPACRTFPETGHDVCYAFLQFFEAYGGVNQFGYPVSDLEIRGERYVQYFEKACFEWYPERPAGQRVVLSDLGTQYFYFRGEDPSRILPSDGNARPQALRLTVQAFTQQAVTGTTGTQTVFVIVRDQTSQPIPGVQITMRVRMPSGEESQFVFPTFTDSQGVAQYSFPFNASSIGEVEIQVIATYYHLQEKTCTSFRAWW